MGRTPTCPLTWCTIRAHPTQRNCEVGGRVLTSQGLAVSNELLAGVMAKARANVISPGDRADQDPGARSTLREKESTPPPCRRVALGGKPREGQVKDESQVS